jgi:hypothetical protein
VHNVVAGVVDVLVKTTDPVGRAGGAPKMYAGVTVAEKVTDALTVEGDGEAVTVVVVAVVLTT